MTATAAGRGRVAGRRRPTRGTRSQSPPRRRRPEPQAREALLGLGSNVLPERNLPAALARLAAGMRVLAVSRAWRTPPVDVGGGEFLNAAALVAAPAGGLAGLRGRLRAIEVAMGRPADHDPSAARPIDLDVLAWRRPGGAWRVVEPTLAEQPWQLMPALELAPGLRLAGGVAASQAVARRPLVGARLYDKPIFPSGAVFPVAAR